MKVLDKCAPPSKRRLQTSLVWWIWCNSSDEETHVATTRVSVLLTGNVRSQVWTDGTYRDPLPSPHPFKQNSSEQNQY